MPEFLMPSLGADMESGTLVLWRKHPGDVLKRGDIIAEVDTDKGVIEVEVFSAGVVERLLVAEGTRVPVGTPLALIRGDQPEASRPRTPVSPAARRRARELDVDPSGLTGTGPEGTVTLSDVERAAPGAPAHAAAPEPAPDQRRMRRAIAAAMERANREIPHFWLSHPVCFDEARHFLGRVHAQRAAPNRLLHAVLLIKAVALAVSDFPELNARWNDGETIVSSNVNVSMAISLRDGGLVIPAILDANRCSLDELMERLTDLVERARRGQLRSSELSAGTITVTSLGDRGARSVAGVIYPPQTALVGFGAPILRPWVVGSEIVPRWLIDVTLAADHRVSDGHRGSRFLSKLEKLLRSPEKL